MPRTRHVLSIARPDSALRGTLRLLEAALCALILVTLAAMASPVFAAQDWPEIPKPPKAQTQWIAQSMRVNGVPTRVFQFQSEASRQEVVEFYRAYWTGGYEHAPSVHPFGDATVVGQKHGPYLLTVKVMDGEKGTSRGIISEAQVVGSKIDRSPGLVPLMPGAQVTQVVESDDPGKHSRQVVIVTTQAPVTVGRYYQASFLKAGWRQIQGAASPAALGRQSAGTFFTFSRGPSEMQMSIAKVATGQGTVVLANLVTKDTGLRGR